MIGAGLVRNFTQQISAVKASVLAQLAAAAGATLVSFQAAGVGAAVRTLYAVLMDQPMSVKNFGAKGDGATDDTAAIQAALNASRNVLIPEGVHLFSVITLPARGTVLRGLGLRSILKHTGAGTAIALADAAAKVYPTARNAYVQDGQFTLSDFTLYTNGPKGIDCAKTRSTGSVIERLYLMPVAYYDTGTQSTYQAGTTAISCDNDPWQAAYATYGVKVRDCTVSGYENIALLNATVNFWTFSGIYGIDNLNFLKLGTTGGATGITAQGCYHETAIAAARGVVFGAGGGNDINLSGCTFELTNAAATQYAYDFAAAAAGAWTDVRVSGAKYLIQGDGSGVNNRRITGAAPATFMEFARSYLSPSYGTIPMVWAPGATAAAPVSYPNFMKLGGPSMGHGRILLSRSGTDASDGYIENDGAYGLNFVAPGTGGTTDFNWKNASGTSALKFTSYGTPAFTPGSDNQVALGSAANRWSTVYCVQVKQTPVTVANLPGAAAAGQGARAFVTDATTTAFASLVAGGGANPLPVYSDGAAWRIG